MRGWATGGTATLGYVLDVKWGGRGSVVPSGVVKPMEWDNGVEIPEKASVGLSEKGAAEIDKLVLTALAKDDTGGVVVVGGRSECVVTGQSRVVGVVRGGTTILVNWLWRSWGFDFFQTGTHATGPPGRGR